MKLRCIFVLLLLLISLVGVAVGAEEKLKVKNTDGSAKTTDSTPKKKISLEDAASQNDEFEDAGVISKGSSEDKKEESKEEQPVGTEQADNEDYIMNEVAAGNKLFLFELANGIYEEFQNSQVKDENGNTAGMIYTAVTFVPNPYENRTVVELYGGYTNLCLFLAVLFVLGELVSRNIDRMKITHNSKYGLPQRKLVGGVAMCGFAMMGHVFYMLALDIIEELNEFITLPVVPAMTPDPEHTITFLMMGLCDLLVVIFFIIRYFLIYIFAVICSLIFVLYVFRISRDFSRDTIEKMIRVLMLQPGALSVTSICIIAMQDLPLVLQPGGYVGVTVVIFLTCYYLLTGNFTLLKKGIQLAVTKGISYTRGARL